MSTSAVTDAPRPTAWRLFMIFARIGLTSFGGGLSGWLWREFVQDRHWLTEEEFFNGLSLAQALPGINVKNMAIWIGYKLAGPRGAAAGFFGIILPPATFIVLLGAIAASLERFELTTIVLAGAAAAAIGLSGSMAVTAVRSMPRRLPPLVFLATTFIAVGLLQWPLLWVVLAEGGLSVALEYWRLVRNEEV